MVIEERYLVDAEGNRVAVVLDLETYHRLLKAKRELEDIRVYDVEKAVNDEAIRFDQEPTEIETRNRSWKVRFLSLVLVLIIVLGVLRVLLIVPE